MRGADQAALVDQEAARGPVQAASGVRADIQERRDGIAATQHDQRLARAVDLGDDFERTALGYLVDRAQSFGFR